MGKKKTSKNQRILLDDDERKVDPGTASNTEDPQGTPLMLMQLYISNIFTAGIMSEWAMSTIEDNLETPRVMSLARTWIESSMHGEEEKG